MAVNHIKVSEHQVKMDNHDSYKRFIKEQVRIYLTDAKLEVIDVYNMKGVSSTTLAGNKERLVILGNHTQSGAGNERAEINGISLLNPCGAGTLITSEDGVVLAEVLKPENGSHLQLNILFDLFGAFNDVNRALFKYIMKELNEKVFRKELLDFSWKHTTQREKLTAVFTEQIKVSQEKYIKDDTRRVNNIEDQIREYIRELKNRYDERIRLNNQIESAKARLDKVDDKLIKDLDNIIANKKVKDLYIRDNKFVVETNPIYAYHDKTGERYYIGNMRIEMQPSNTDVRFYGDNPRRSHWTQADPHPHVDGHNGHACLGNVGSTIAELCSQMELYALTMICIDFLESVNTEDSAGRNIINWDKVDEEGKVIIAPEPEPEPEDTWVCDFCEETCPDHEESFRVFESYTGDAEGNGNWGEERFVCEDCLNDHYIYHECLDEHIREGHCDIEEDEEEEEEENEF